MRNVAWIGLACLLSCSREVALFERTGDPQDGATSSRDAGNDGGQDGAPDPRTDAGARPDASAGQDGGSASPTRMALRAGINHTCAVVDGSLFCWGEGTSARLGLGDETSRNAPTRLDTRTDWVTVCAGEAHGCALREDQSLHCWGSNGHGELGLGDTAQRDRPTQVPGASFVAIACGGFTTCGVTSTESVFCWGDNFEGKIGQDDLFGSPDALTPTRIASALPFRDVSVGQGHACGITRSGELYCWGRNTENQLGLARPEEQVRVPTRVASLGAVRTVAAGQEHSCAIDVDGSLWCWGRDLQGSLGLGLADGTEVDTPRRVGSNRMWQEVALKRFHTCATRSPGELYCWGRGIEGQLGRGDEQGQDTPTRVGNVSDWSHVALGGFHTCATRMNAVWCWGINDADGQLGQGNIANQNEPGRLTLP